LSCLEQGDPSGTPLLLIHGYSDSWKTFELLLPELPTSLRVIAVTMRGHGESSKPDTAYSASAFAADVAALMDKLAIARAVIVGHSMGSLIAEKFAFDYSERVLGLVLIGAFATYKGNADVMDLWDNVVAGMGEAADPVFVREFQESTFTRPVPAGFVETVIAESLKVPGHVWRETLRAMLDEDYTGEFGRIVAPVLIIAGEKDIYANAAEQQRLVRAIPHAELVVHKDTGHCPHWESPRRTAGEIVAFLEVMPVTARTAA
jgi:pimeloyl-ACP methyl ester carboxylesterase